MIKYPIISLILWYFFVSRQNFVFLIPYVGAKFQRKKLDFCESVKTGYSGIWFS